jgi:glucose dehydrogenase
VCGYVSAYDANTGKLDWRFYAIPGDPSKPVENPALTKALTTWNGEWWKTGGGDTVWDTFPYDPDADLLYVGNGNGGPWNREVRSPGGGDNLYLSCILVLKPDTGNLVWYYQTTPGDSWDFTATQSPILADLTIAGRQRKVIMQAPKNGFFYVVDRLTGELLSAKAFTDINWATGVDMKTGKPIETPEARYINGPVLIWAGAGGAHSWQPMAYSPDTKLAYIPGTNAAFAFAPDPNYKWQRKKQNFAATFTRPPDAKNPPTPNGFLVAWVPATNQERWRVPYPGRPGGVVATGGNLVLHGGADGRMIAYSADKGMKLWEVNIGGGIATPVTYMLDGKRYVSVSSGRNGGRLFALFWMARSRFQRLPRRPRDEDAAQLRALHLLALHLLALHLLALHLQVAEESAEGPRSLLKVRLADLATSSRGQGFRLFAPLRGRRFVCASLAVALVGFAAGTLHRRAMRINSARSSSVRDAGLVPDPRLTPGATRSINRDDVCSLRNTSRSPHSRIPG